MRNFNIYVSSKKRGWGRRPIYMITISDGSNEITFREESGFQVKTKVKFPKKIIFE